MFSGKGHIVSISEFAGHTFTGHAVYVTCFFVCCFFFLYSFKVVKSFLVLETCKERPWFLFAPLFNRLLLNGLDSLFIILDI